MSIQNEMSLLEMIEKNPDFPHYIMIKIDAQRRGITFSESALKKVNPEIHQVQVRSFSREINGLTPVALMMRDGTSIIARSNDEIDQNDPLLSDVDRNGDIVIRDGEVILEQVYYWEKPDYYDKKTKNGIPMWTVVNARPQRLDINPYQYCHMWSKKDMGCKFCSIKDIYKKSNKPMFLDIEDINDTITEALKEKGRFTNIFLTGGTNLQGKELFDKEISLYIKILKMIGTHFRTNKFPSQLIGSAYNKKQLEILYNETGLMSYSANLEVLNEERFNWICPGKAKYIGYKEWKERLFQAVEIFGRGYVNTGIVCGVEMARPYGFECEEEGIEKTLLEAENLMGRGVDVVSCVWRVSKESAFRYQRIPSLDYYIKIVKGLNNLRHKYGLFSDMDNYRRCGNHPDTDFLRVW